MNILTVLIVSIFVITICNSLISSKTKEKLNIKVIVPQIFASLFISFWVMMMSFESFNAISFEEKYAHYIKYSAVIGLAVSLLVLVICTLMKKHNAYNKNIKKEIKKTLAVKKVFFIIFALTSCLFCGFFFVITQWSGVDPEQMLINVTSPTAGTEISIYYTGFQYVFMALSMIYLFGCVIFSDFLLKELRRSEKSLKRFELARAIICIVISLSFLSGTIESLEKVFKIHSGVNAVFVNSDFIEKNYVDPEKATITFPKEKRNLIFIYLESIENSYLSKELGGYMEENLMPELTELAYSGITFSDNSTKFGGPSPITGTTWSLASMVNQTMGLPLKFTGSLSSYSEPNAFMKGTTALGDILYEQGYEQTVMIGANAIFGGLEYMYKTHGNYKVFDYNYARKNGYIPNDYKVWWGYEDDKLYEFAKEEITRLYKTGKPFNFTMENADTHMPDGYLAPDKPRPYKSPYANAIAYSTSQIVKFVEWIQAQPFYGNTTVILIGDHLSMDKNFFMGFDPSYKRTQFNLILNSAKEADSSRLVNRDYSNLDMFPTTLCSLGCDIEGEQLGLGVNLFSNKKTLLEEYGVDYVDNEFTKKSTFYNKVLSRAD